MNIRAASRTEPTPDVVSVASDPSPSASSHDIIEFQQYGNVQHSFNMLQDSDTSRATSRSESSGLSTYADAPSDVADPDNDEHSIEQLRQHLMSPASSSGQGLIAVTPLKSSGLTVSPGSPQSHSFLSGAHGSSPRHADDVAASSSFMLSPNTPRRRGLRPGPPPPLPISRPPEAPPSRNTDEPIPPSPLQRMVPRPPPPPRRPPTGQLHFSFGQPRQVSDSRSLRSQGSHVSDDGHIEPNRHVRQHAFSYIKRSGPVMGSNGPYLAGLPRLPVFPISRSNHSGLELEKRDAWGRREARPSVAWAILLLCTVFPPLWLLLGAGYFDSACGVLPRIVKLTAMGLALVTLAAVIALVTVFGVLRT